MFKKLYCLALVISISLPLFSQKNVEPTETEKTNASKLKALYPDDHVALQNYSDVITFDLDKREQKVTVEQFTEQDYINMDSRADIQMYSFYDGESTIGVFDINYKNGKPTSFYLKDEAYKSSDLFHNDARVKYTHVDFPLKGYRYLTELRKHYKDIKYFTKLYFNSEYPTVKRTISIEIPEWLDVELKEMNFEGYSIKKNVTTDSKSKAKTFTFTMENVPAMFDESNAPGPTYIYPHILILAKSYTYNDAVQPIFNSTQDLYNWYKSLVDELENDNSAFKDKVTELTSSAKSDEEKIKNIYYWVQDNIRYIAFEDGIAGFKPDEASNVYNKKYGDCKGMANLTKQMLVEAGFDARLTWIGTKHIAYDYSTPNLSVDNHMICTLFKDGQAIFLDGTEKFNAYGEYADRIQGKQVMIEDGDKFILKNVPTHDAQFNKENINYTLKLSEESISGKVDKTYRGESRSSLLYYFNTLKNDKKDEFLEYYLNKGNSNIKVSGINTTDLLDRDANIDISYDINIKNAVSSFDDLIYVDLDIDKELSGYELEKRKTDYMFSSKKDLESNLRLEIPIGYKVSHLPENISVKSKNYDMSVAFSKEGNAIVYKKRFKIKNAQIETADFEEWNGFIKKLNTLYNEQIILTKE
ncbi:transglutaminase-like domain-containing protein [Subsaxibacter sp. CAU 1640]|uniref:transglutaminase-like domain-containing protein n=1 Tax=Subsaxibacter sp. CAU 1640 TaxID=2933271 RepID=UPI0020068DB4|nr:transglutaminase-like domain-containing protein [Subsaxibacter sp. CAU 1640]MCK7590637.1 transglutaminase-like domain-containing protein [Subsaxibacter sp. CAU 1640]